MKKMFLEEGKDYIFVDSDDSLITGIKLLTGPFSGVLYHYLKVRVAEENGVAKLQFGYTVVDPGENDIDELTKSEEFHTIMGELLTHFISIKLKEEDEQIRKIDSQESNLQ